MVISVGCKVLALFPNSENNMRTKTHWKVADGLSAFENVIVVDMQPGDLVAIPCDWNYMYYSVEDSLVHGGFYMLPQTLETNLRTLTEKGDCEALSMDDIVKYFQRIVEVITFICKLTIWRLRY